MKKGLTPVEEASRMVMQTARDFGAEKVPLSESVDRILREDIRADRHLPPYDRVTMDGIAIRFEDFQKGQRRFTIAATQGAGEAPKPLTTANACIEIMTGAMLGDDADTVIRYEDLEMENGKAIIHTDRVKKGQNIHTTGEDATKGDILVKSGIRIGAPEIAIAASVGKSEIAVSQLPSIALFASGDELVGIDNNPLPHQIRSSNTKTLQAALKQFGISAGTDHLPDERDVIREKLEKALAAHDVIVLTGGVSKGKYDYVAAMLEELGVDKLFHRVAQRPGKPFWFGTYSSTETVVFALPGNPVSTFMCFYRYVLPWLKKSIQMRNTQQQVASLGEDLEFNRELTWFPAVLAEFTPGGSLEASICKGRGSGDFVHLHRANGFLELPADKSRFMRGESYPFIPFRNFM